MGIWPRMLSVCQHRGHDDQACHSSIAVADEAPWQWLTWCLIQHGGSLGSGLPSTTLKALTLYLTIANTLMMFSGMDYMQTIIDLRRRLEKLNPP